MDKLVGAYSIKYKSRRWHAAVFCNRIHLLCLNTFKLLLEVLLYRDDNKSHKRWLLLTQLGLNLTAEKKITPALPLPTFEERTGSKRGRRKLCGRNPDTKVKQKCAVCHTFCWAVHSNTMFQLCLNLNFLILHPHCIFYTLLHFILLAIRLVSAVIYIYILYYIIYSGIKVHCI